MAVPTSIDGSAPTGPSGTSVVRPFSNSAAPSKPLVPALEVKDVTTQAPIATGPGRRERSSKAWVIAGALMVGALGGAGLFAMTMAQPDESTRDTSAEKPTVAAELTATRPEQGAAGEIQSPAPVASAAPITAGAMATTSASAVQKTSAPVRAPTNGPKRAAQPAATAVAAPCKANDMFGIPCGSSK
jgi:hypothetical protein